MTTSSLPTTTQKLTVGQDTPAGMWLGLPSSVAVQADAPPVGFVEVMMSVAGSSATQSRVVGQ